MGGFHQLKPEKPVAAIIIGESIYQDVKEAEGDAHFVSEYVLE